MAQVLVASHNDPLYDNVLRETRLIVARKNEISLR